MIGRFKLNIQFIISLFTLSIIFACGGNRQESEAQLIEQLTEELNNIELDDITEENDYVFEPDVVIYDEAERVAEISGEIKLFSATELLDEELSIGEKYVMGDETYRDEIIELTEQADEDDYKYKIMGDLMAYSFPEFKMKDRRMRSAIVEMLNQLHYENIAIRLIQKHHFKNEQKILEDRLISGASFYEHNLFQKIAQADYEPSLEVLSYLKDRLYEKIYLENELQTIIQGLSAYYDKGSAEIKRIVKDMAIMLYSSQSIEESDFIALKTNFNYGAASQLLRLMFKCKGEDIIIPIAKKYLNAPTLMIPALSFLIHEEGDKHRLTLLEKFKSKETYYDALELLPAYYELTKDDKMVRSAIISFEKLYGPHDYSNWDLKNLTADMLAVKGDSITIDFDNYLKGEALKQDVMEWLELEKMSMQDAADFLLEVKLVDEPINITKLNPRKGEIWDGKILYLLAQMDCKFWYDNEYGVISEWKGIGNDFVKNSNGNLNGIELMVEWQEGYDTHFQAVLNDKAYSVFFPEREEWDATYMEDYVFFINFILEDQGVAKRFINFDYDSYVFGTERAVYLLERKLKIDYDSNY